jgi:hypothetical protein
MTLQSFRVFEFKTAGKKVQFITLPLIAPPPPHPDAEAPDIKDAWFIKLVSMSPEEALESTAKFIVYEKRLYKNIAPSGKILLNAVLHNISPETSALLAPINDSFT